MMSLFEHLAELRVCIFKALAGVFLAFCVALFYSSTILNYCKKPLVEALGRGDVLHFTGPLDVFMASIKVSMIVGVIASSPIWIYQFWKFIEPALYERERRWILPFVFASTVLFLIGIFLCYFVILPLTLEFLLHLGMEVGTPMITVADYLSLVSIMLLGFGFVFEAPLVLVLLAALEILTAESLSVARRYVIVGILFVAAVLTPPDPLSQIGMAIPLYILYEVAIVVIRFMERRRGPKATEKTLVSQNDSGGTAT